MFAKSDSFEAAIDKINSGVVSVDTGQALLFDRIKEAIPDIQVVVIKRDAGEVISSLKRCGIYGADKYVYDQSSVIERLSKVYPTIDTFEFESGLKYSWHNISYTEFPQDTFDIMNGYRIEFLDLLNSAKSIGANKILDAYGIKRTT